MRPLSLALLLACGAATAQPRLALPLTIVMIDGSGWSRERADSALSDAAAILAQCGIAVEHAGFHVVEARQMDFSTPAARELARSYPVARPTLYLVRDTKS